jgi:diguanylate cyclase (GGDEF)-like protein
MEIVKRRENQTFFTILGFVIFLEVLVALLYLAPLPEELRPIISGILLPLFNLAACISLVYVALSTRSYSKKMATAWLLLAAAMFANFMGEFLWSIIENILQIDPYPSIADVAYLLFYPLFFAGILSFPSVDRQNYGRVNRILDLIILLVGGSLITWIVIIGPIIQVDDFESMYNTFLNLAYPIGDTVIFWAVLISIYDRKYQRVGMPLLLIVIAVIVMIVTDVIFSLQDIYETYSSGNFLDFGYAFFPLTVGLAAIWQVYIIRISERSGFNGNKFVQSVNNLFSFLPYLMVISGLMILIHSYYFELALNYFYLAVSVLFITLLVFARQISSNIQIRNLILEVENSRIKDIKQTRDIHMNSLLDDLTGLPTRELLIDRLDSAIANQKRRSDDPFALLFLDLDEFKKVNDTYGHEIGDKLLIEVATRLRNSTRNNDTIARLGGDEFLILLEDAGNRNSITHTTNRIIQVIKQPYTVGDLCLNISCSVGIVEGIRNYRHSSDILRDADIAMYHAKASGKSCYAIFENEMREKAVIKVVIENELRSAIETNQFKLVYQPIISLNTGRMVGLEALIRWQNLRLGLVMPDDFIAIAEETGLIISIGEWVLNESCRQMKEWQVYYPIPEDLFVSVNISSLQFSKTDFLQTVQNALKTSGLSPESLVLEITESVVIDEKLRASRLFENLHDLGVRFQIDDFGTGYSSLNYLQKFPVYGVKIDRSFIREMADSDKNKELIRGIINMSEGIGLITTAEGIESKEQKEMVISMGCVHGQGYLWDKPLDPLHVGQKLGELVHTTGTT